MEIVEYELLRPEELSLRMERLPLAYLPLGTLEWHGRHMPLGSDGLQAHAFMRRCALRYGGVVLPPIWLGPDIIREQKDGTVLIGMDNSEFTQPNQILTGSAYHISEERFEQLLDTILFNCSRAGFKAVFADGHGPSRISWCAHAGKFEKRYGLKILGIHESDYPHWQIQMDHGGVNETSLMMHYHPQRVDLSTLGTDRSVQPLGVGVQDPRDSSAEIGEACTEHSLSYFGRMLTASGLLGS